MCTSIVQNSKFDFLICSADPVSDLQYDGLLAVRRNIKFGVVEGYLTIFMGKR
jgi:hypothetical protein